MYIRKSLRECLQHSALVELVDERTHQTIISSIPREEAIKRYGDWIVESGYTSGFSGDPVYRFTTVLWIYPKEV